MSADGSGQTNLSWNTANDFDPAWSPDGREIVFVSSRDSRLNVCIMAADSSGQRRLTDSSGYDGQPWWVP